MSDTKFKRTVQSTDRQVTCGESICCDSAPVSEKQGLKRVKQPTPNHDIGGASGKYSMLSMGLAP